MPTLSNFRIAPCLIGEQVLCFESDQILSINSLSECKSVDQTEDGLVGCVEYEGAEIPVFLLRELLELTSRRNPTEDDRLVICSTSERPCGYVVDDVQRALIPDQVLEISPIARTPEKPYFSGIATWDDNDGRFNRRREAFVLSSDGLSGTGANKAGRFPKAIAHMAHAYDTGQRKNQLMLFDVPHQAWDDQVISVTLSVSQVLEVIKPRPLIPLPCAPEGICGFVAWRDQHVPVVDLTHHLTLGSIPHAARQRLVIARENEDLVAFYTCESIRTLTKPFNAQPLKMNGISTSKWVKGTFSTEDAVLVVPSFAISS